MSCIKLPQKYKEYPHDEKVCYEINVLVRMFINPWPEAR